MNAKELILKKINADTNWVDIYTSGVILGEDINAIGNFMTSQVINDLVSKYNTSAFDTEYVGTKIDFIRKAIASETDSNKITAYNELLRRVYIAEELRIMGKILKINQGMPTNFNDLQQYISSIEEYIESRLNHVNLENYQNTISQFSELKKRLGLSEELTKEEMNIPEVANALKQIKKAKEQMTSNWIYFNLVKFVQEEEYAQQMDNMYEGVKVTFNILNTLRNSPHFSEMFNVLGLNNTILTSLSKRNLIERTIWNTAAHKSSRGQKVIYKKLNSTERSTLKTLVDDTLADTWIKTNIRNSDGSPVKIIWTVNEKSNVVTFDGGFDYKLFIKYIETELIPRLRNNGLVVNGRTINTADNAFIKHLTFGKDRDGNTIFRLPYNMTQIDKNPGIQMEYEKILGAFGQLRGIILDNGLSIVDMFYLYNLIIHKDKINSRYSLTRLFEDLIASEGGEQLLVFKFNEWLETVNEDEIINKVLGKWGAVHSNDNIGKSNTSYSHLVITPKFDADKTATIKARISNKFIGFGPEGGSTYYYAQQAGSSANTGDYTAEDVIFVSVPGKRGDAQIRKQYQDQTIREAIKALAAGATLITDSAEYLATSEYNEGERRLAQNLQYLGYQYETIVVDGYQIGKWTNPKNTETTPKMESKTVKYIPKGQSEQTYTIIGNKIFNSKGEEVYADTNNGHRQLIFVELALQEKRAVKVEYRNVTYVVNDRNQIFSTSSNKIVYQNENDGNRRLILEKAKEEFAKLSNQSSPRAEIYQGYWTRKEVESQTDKVFLFGDNTDDRINTHHIPSRTQAVIRGLDNAIGIDTKKNRGTSESSYFTDADFDIFKAQVDEAIQRAIDSGKTIVIPADGIGTGKAELEKRAPKLFAYLQQKLDELKSLNSTNPVQLSLNFGENDDPERFNTAEESIAILESPKTILSNSELQLWSHVTNPKILVASEHSDPAFHTKKILEVINGTRNVTDWKGDNFTGNQFDGLYIITKHDGLPIRKLLETKIPKLIHFSITTLGGTKYEPGVMKYNDLLDRIAEYIKLGLDPNTITIRIDPIVPGETKWEDIETVMRRSAEMGIKRIKFSIMDAYPNTIKAMTELGYSFETYYETKTNFTVNGQYRFHAKADVQKDFATRMLQLSQKYNLELHTCAEPLVLPGILHEGCLSVNAVNEMLGTHIEDKGYENNKSRQLCSCFGGKIDVLKYGDHCSSHCIYCYAKHENDRAMQYYNEDGTLKRNAFTDIYWDDQYNIEDISEESVAEESVTIGFDNTVERVDNETDSSITQDEVESILSTPKVIPTGQYKYIQSLAGKQFLSTEAAIIYYVMEIAKLDPNANFEILSKIEKAQQEILNGLNSEQIAEVFEVATKDLKMIEWNDDLMTKLNLGMLELNRILTDIVADSLHIDSDYIAEREEILRNAPRNSEGKLLAPNDKVSKLSEEQWVTVRTKAFKEWFGDWTKITQNVDGSWNIPDDVSKVIDTETGEPKVVYHGTTSDFTSFSKEKLGKFTGSKSAKLAFFAASNEDMAKDIYAQMESNEHFYQRTIEKDPNYTREDLGIGPDVDFFENENELIYSEWANYYKELDYEYADVINELNQHRHLQKTTLSKKINKGESWVTDLDIEDYIKDGYYISEKQRKEYEEGKDIIIYKDVDIYSDINKEDADKILNTDRSREFVHKLKELNAVLEKEVKETQKKSINFYNNRVKPLFLNIRNPKIDSDHNKKYRQETYAKRVQEAINNKNDGGIIEKTRDPYLTDVYYFFEPNQVKSAIGAHEFTPSQNIYDADPTPVYQTTPSKQSKLIEVVRQANEKGIKGLHAVYQSDLINEDVYIRSANGFVRNGEIYINVDRAGDDTVIHEFGHLYLADAKNNNRLAYYALLEKVKDTELWKRMRTWAAYSNKVGSDFDEEILATMIGEYYKSGFENYEYESLVKEALELVDPAFIELLNSEILPDLGDTFITNYHFQQKVATWKSKLVSDNILKENCL